MPILYQTWIMRDDLRRNPDVLYVFGDNEARVGLGGQAKEMRGEPNAVGVATLKAPGVFWSDEDFIRQNKVVNQDFAPIEKALKQGKLIVWPLAGVGTGLSSLDTASPKTFAHILGWHEALILLAK